MWSFVGKTYFVYIEESDIQLAVNIQSKKTIVIRDADNANQQIASGTGLNSPASTTSTDSNKGHKLTVVCS